MTESLNCERLNQVTTKLLTLTKYTNQTLVTRAQKFVWVVNKLKLRFETKPNSTYGDSNSGKMLSKMKI